MQAQEWKWKLGEVISSQAEPILLKLHYEVYIACEYKEISYGFVWNDKCTSGQIEDLANQLKSNAPLDQWTIKLLGKEGKISKLEPQLVTLNIPITKKVPRDSKFQVIHDMKGHHLKVTKGDEALRPIKKESPKVSTTVDAKKEPEVKKENPPSEISRQGKVKVLIIDDSKTIRNVLKLVCSQDPEVEVIGEIEDPMKAEDFLSKNQVDVITLDIHMPGMDGVQLLAKIHPKYHIPTVMISALSKDDGPYVLNALEIGAVDYIQKPSMEEIKKKGPEIVERIKTAALARVKPKEKRQAAKVSNGPVDPSYIVAIGSSTGGTEALKDLLTQLPAEIPPILIVQHIPAVFSAALANRLNGLCKFEVKEAADMDSVKPNTVLIAPGGRQMKMAKDGKGGYCVRVTDDPSYNRHRPSVDFLFDSIAELAPPKLVGVILTGMGSDGARGLLKLKNKGAWTIAQDASSCVVYGMPRAAVELGAHEEQLSLMDIPSAIIRECQQAKKAS